MGERPRRLSFDFRSGRKLRSLRPRPGVAAAFALSKNSRNVHVAKRSNSSLLPAVDYEALRVASRAEAIFTLIIKHGRTLKSCGRLIDLCPVIAERLDAIECSLAESCSLLIERSETPDEGQGRGL